MSEGGGSFVAGCRRMSGDGRHPLGGEERVRKDGPRAKKVVHKMEMFGDVREDPYYWLRDDSRSNPDVLAYLEEENHYTEETLADTKSLQKELYKEIRGRIQEEDMTVPLRKGPFFYYEKNIEGKQYIQHCRRAIISGEGRAFVDEVMDDTNAVEEQVLLDENVIAANHEFYNVGGFEVSPDHHLFAYAEDTKGDEIYTIYIVDAQSKGNIGKPLTGVTENFNWVDNEHLVYIAQDDLHRPFQVLCHKLHTDQSEDRLLYHEQDEEFFLQLTASESKEYLFVNSGSKTTEFVLSLHVSDPSIKLKLLTPRIQGMGTSVSHTRGHFFIKRRSDEMYNSELLVCPVDDTNATSVLIPHKPSVKLQDVQTSENHIIVFQREEGLLNVQIYALPPVGEPITHLPEGRKIEFSESVHAITPMDCQFTSSVLRFGYSSLRTPFSVYDYDMDSRKSVLKKVGPVLGGFDASKYETMRRWAIAADGVHIPISVVYRKDLVKLDGTDPLLLYGYGSYEVCIEPEFKAERLSLIDRGFLFAIAHIRGGGEMGRKWYEDGKLLKKKNTFNDFIACAEYLISHKFTTKDKLCISGRSAGGLLIGAVLNLRPDLFKVAVAAVPFVDVVTTMLDASIPLTTAEWEEWGDPRNEEFYHYMKSYSPVDNIEARDYPHILITAGLHDSRVGYWEATKLVAKLREKKTDGNFVLLKCDLGAGHTSKSGRFEKLEEIALIYAFILKYLGDNIQ